MSTYIIPISKGQLYALVKLADAVGANSRYERIKLVEYLIGRDIESTKELSRTEWAKIRDAAYPHWYHNDWAMSNTFRARCLDFLREKREQDGQLPLFEEETDGH